MTPHAKVLAAVLLAALVGVGAWLPLARERERLRAELPPLRAELREMRSDAQELARLRAAAKPSTPDLAATLAQSARQRFAQATLEVSARPAGRALLVLRGVRADEWFAWAAALHAERGIRVESATLEATNEPGVVRVSATFAGPG